MSDVLPRAQPYIQLEETMKTSFKHFTKPDNHEGKSKSPTKPPPMPKLKIGGNLPTREVLSILSPSLFQAYKPIEQFTPLRLPINEVFNINKD